MQICPLLHYILYCLLREVEEEFLRLSERAKLGKSYDKGDFNTFDVASAFINIQLLVNWIKSITVTI